MTQGATAEDFVALIRRQADNRAQADVKTVEYVAATVDRVQNFSNLGRTSAGHEIAVDEPQQFGGTGGAPDPAELLLIAVGASLSVTLTVHAVLADLSLHDIAIALKAKLDPERFFEPASDPGGGFYDLEIDLSLISDGDETAIKSLVEKAMVACPMLRSVDAIPTLKLVIRSAAQ